MIDPTQLEDAPTLPVSERCRYPSKFCRNRRSHKPNGELHRFCVYHRAKANLNQKRWSTNRRSRGVATRHKSDSDGSSREALLSPRSASATESQTTVPDYENDKGEAPSFTSLLTMRQPQPFDATCKREIFTDDDQLNAFLRDLLLSLDAFPSTDGAAVNYPTLGNLEGFQIAL